jgi:DNA adenine methylase
MYSRKFIILRRVDTMVRNTNQSLSEVRPFLRWAGGKRWLKPVITDLLISANFNTYHEPFLGGGSILFHINNRKSIVSDLNSELIITYKAVKKNVYLVIEQIKKFSIEKEFYYALREQEFKCNFKRAARFIYLNQTSFNGIYRENLNGKYNVPYGFRKNFQFDFDNLIKVGEFLKNVKIKNQDFSSSLDAVKKGDLVFLDPPYTIAHNKNGFIQYNQRLFSLHDQLRLSEAIDSIKSKGAYYILTNAAHEMVFEIFDKGDLQIELSRASVVGGIREARGRYSEFLFTNL